MRTSTSWLVAAVLLFSASGCACRQATDDAEGASVVAAIGIGIALARRRRRATLGW